jgi:hypothetical protein
LHGDSRRRRFRSLVNFQRKDRGRDQHCRDGDWTRAQGRQIQPEHGILRALQNDSPNWLTKKFVTLTTMKFVQEIFEVTRRRLLVTLQAQEARDLFKVLIVVGIQETGFFLNSSK